MTQPTNAGESLGTMDEYRDRFPKPAPTEQVNHLARSGPWVPQLDGAENTLEAAVYQALGAASMAWNPPPSGVFVSEHARWVGEGLLTYLREHGVQA